MKKSQYKCDCGHVMNTANRDNGTAPMKIGCVKCGQLSQSMMATDDETIQPEMIFIKPRNDDEWKIVRGQMKEEIRMTYPTKKPRKVDRMTDNMMFRIRDHVNKGGLVQLPFHIVEALEEYSQKKN